MAFNKYREDRQVRRLESTADDLRDMVQELKGFKLDLQGVWQGDEIKYIESAIERMSIKSQKLISSINEVNSDIRSAIREIEREEEERRRREQANRW